MFHDPSIWDMFPLSFFYELKRRLGGKGLKHLHSLITKYNLQTLPDFKDFTSFSIDNDVKLPDWFGHSMNPAGRENIDAYLTNYRKHEKNN